MDIVQTKTAKRSVIKIFLAVVGILLLIVLIALLSLKIIIDLQTSSNKTQTANDNTAVISDDTEEETSLPDQDSLVDKLNSNYNYYILSDCNVAVPISRKSEYNELDEMDQGRYWSLENYAPDNSINSTIRVSYMGLPEDMALNPLKYANDYIPATYSVSCNEFPEGIDTVDELLNYENEKMAESNLGNILIQLIKISTQTKWGQDGVLQYKATEGQYSQDYLSFWIPRDKGYVSISGVSYTSSESLKKDWQKLMDSIIFY